MQRWCLAYTTLQLYQHHINRANNKLAAMFKRAPLSEKQIRRELERRKLSILARGSTGFEQRAILPDLNSNVNHPARRSRWAAPAQASPRSVKPRLGYTKPGIQISSEDRREVQGGTIKRSLQELITSLFTTAHRPSSSSSEPKSMKQSAATTSANKDYDMAQGYPKASLDASTSDGLYDAQKPTAAQSLGLDIEANDIGYVVDVKIGSDQAPFRLLVDSGSADTWVPSTKCTVCSNKSQKLGKSTSSTFRAVDEKFSIQYGTGDVSGTLAKDSLVIAGMELKNHTMGLVTKESVEFSDDSVPFDGLMGLAKGELSNAGVPTPIESLFEAGLVGAPVMGYHLGRVADGFNDGQVTFGGVDSTRFTGNLTEIQNVSTEGFWEAPIDAISFGGKDLGLQGRTAILDTGTTLIVAPPEDADKLHAAIPGSKSDGQGGYTIPCTTSKSVALTLGGKQFSIDPRDLIFLPVDNNDLKGDCVSSISSGQIGQDKEWLVGATFLKNVYFATNVETNTIGLATLGNSTTSTSPAKQAAKACKTSSSSKSKSE